MDGILIMTNYVLSRFCGKVSTTANSFTHYFSDLFEFEAQKELYIAIHSEALSHCGLCVYLTNDIALKAGGNILQATFNMTLNKDVKFERAGLLLVFFFVAVIQVM